MNLKRLLHIGTNGAATMMQSLCVLALSFIILGRGGGVLWGEFMYAYFTVELMAFVANWGFKEYLLLQGSREPGKQSVYYGQTLFSRMGISAIASLVILALPLFSWEVKCLLVANGLMRVFIGSLEFFVVLNQRFLQSFITELVAAAFFAGYVFFGTNEIPSTPGLIWVYSAYNALRAVLLGGFVNDKLRAGFALSLDFRSLRGAAPFFFAALAGFLQYRAVMYMAALLLSKEVFAHLQVSLSMVQASMIAASLLLSPFSAGIYRMDHTALARLKRTLLGAGSVLCVFTAGLIFLLMRYWLEMQVSVYAGLAIYFYILGIYVFMLDVYEMNKTGRKKDVMVYSWLMVAIDFTLSVLLIRLVGLEGAFYAMAGAQVLRVWLFKRKPRVFPVAGGNTSQGEVSRH